MSIHLAKSYQYDECIVAFQLALQWISIQILLILDRLVSPFSFKGKYYQLRTKTIGRTKTRSLKTRVRYNFWQIFAYTAFIHQQKS